MNLSFVRDLLLDDQEDTGNVRAADTRAKTTKGGAMKAVSTSKITKIKLMPMKTIVEATSTSEKPATKLMAMKAMQKLAPETS